MNVQVVRDKTEWKEWKGIIRFTNKKLQPVNLCQDELR